MLTYAEYEVAHDIVCHNGWQPSPPNEILGADNWKWWLGGIIHKPSILPVDIFDRLTNKHKGYDSREEAVYALCEAIHDYEGRQA